MVRSLSVEDFSYYKQLLEIMEDHVEMAMVSS